MEIIWIIIAAALVGAVWFWLKSSSRQADADHTMREARSQLREMAAESVSIHDDLETLKTALAERPNSKGLDIELHGEAQRNTDGQSRQDIIARLKQGEYVALVPEPENRFDANAVRVDSGIGTIGYIPHEHAKHISDLLKSGALSKSYIREIRGGDDGYNYGVILHLETALDHTAQHRDGRHHSGHS